MLKAHRSLLVLTVCAALTTQRVQGVDSRDTGAAECGIEPAGAEASALLQSDHAIKAAAAQPTKKSIGSSSDTAPESKLPKASPDAAVPTSQPGSRLKPAAATEKAMKFAAPLLGEDPLAEASEHSLKLPAASDILEQRPALVPRASGVRMASWTSQTPPAQLVHQETKASVSVVAVHSDTVDEDCEPGSRCVTGELAKLSEHRALCVKPSKDGPNMCWDVCNLTHEPAEYFAGMSIDRSSLPKEAAIGALIDLRKGVFSEKVTCPPAAAAPTAASAAVQGDAVKASEPVFIQTPVLNPPAPSAQTPLTNSPSKTSELDSHPPQPVLAATQPAIASTIVDTIESQTVAAIALDLPDPGCTPAGPCTHTALPSLRGICVQPGGTTAKKAQQCWDVCNTSHSPQDYFAGDADIKVLTQGIQNVRKGLFPKVQCPSQSLVDSSAKKVAHILETAAAGHKEASASARATLTAVADAASREATEHKEEEATALKALANYRHELAKIKKAQLDKALAAAKKAELELQNLEREAAGDTAAVPPLEQPEPKTAQQAQHPVPAVPLVQASRPAVKQDALAAIQGQSSVAHTSQIEAREEASAESAELQEMEALKEAKMQAEETEQFVQEEESEIKEDLFKNVMGQYNKEKRRLEKDLFRHVVNMFDKSHDKKQQDAYDTEEQDDGKDDEEFIGGAQKVMNNDGTRALLLPKAHQGADAKLTKEAKQEAKREAKQTRVPKLSFLQEWLR